MEHKYNGKMVTLARESRGLSQEELAKKISEPQTTVSSIERNQKNEHELYLKISKELDFPLAFFESGNSINRLSKFYYRKRESFPARLMTPTESWMDITRKTYERLLSQVKVNYKGLPEMAVTATSKPEHIADYARMYFNLDDGPIDNPINIIERVGIPVIYFDIDSDKFSGMTIQTDNNIPIIILNKNLPNDHQKFTLFHELGHMIMHSPFTEDPEFYEKLQDKEIVEKEADTFAGAFLMPANKARASMAGLNYHRLTELKMYWKVSKQAILYRAKTLNVVSEPRFKSIYIELSRNGERKKENITIPIDKPKLIKKVVELYKIQLGYNVDSLSREIAAISPKDFKRIFEFEEDSLFTIVRNQNVAR